MPTYIGEKIPTLDDNKRLYWEETFFIFLKKQSGIIQRQVKKYIRYHICRHIIMFV